MPKTRWILAALLTTALGCSADDVGDDPDPDAEPRATWHQDVAPIVAARCTGCHVAGGIGPFTLTDYETASALAPSMLAAVESGIMPPWHAVDGEGCETRFDWKDDPRLTADETATLRAWVEDGAAEGDPDTAAPLTDPTPDELSAVTDHFEPDVSYTTSGFTDELVCFVIDPGLTNLSWITGVQFNPGNLEVVHHATLTAIPPEQVAAVQSRVGPDGTFNCTGGVGIEGAYSLGVWVPGSRPFETPDGTGIPVAAGTAMVLQLHYHPVGFEHEPDLTTIDMRMQANAPGRTFLFTAIGNAGAAPFLQPGPNDSGGVEFRIPAGIKDHIESMEFPINNPNLTSRIPMTSVFPHMHYVGVGLSVTVERATPNPGEPSEECLINIPRWDFDWQRTYDYDARIDELPTIGDGDLIKISCDYNNTLENPFVGRMLEDEGLAAPIDIRLGEETTDEMCLAAFGLIL